MKFSFSLFFGILLLFLIFFNNCILKIIENLITYKKFKIKKIYSLFPSPLREEILADLADSLKIFQINFLPKLTFFSIRQMKFPPKLSFFAIRQIKFPPKLLFFTIRKFFFWFSSITINPGV